MRTVLHRICGLSAAASLAVCASADDRGASETGLAPVDGGHIEYVVTGPEDGEPVLLIHGAVLGTALMLVQEAPALEGYSVIRMHRRGFVGSSDAEGPMPLSRQAGDAVAVLDALGVERAHVAGHSAGAIVALQLAIDAPARIGSLVLVDSAPVRGLAPPGTSAEDFADVIAARQDALIEAISRGFGAGGVEGAIEAFGTVILGDDWREAYDAVPGGYEQAVADLRRFTPGPPAAPFDAARIDAVDQPVLVLRGEHGFEARVASALTAALPNAESGMIEDTDHALVTQRPDAVAEAIAAFVGRQPP